MKRILTVSAVALMAFSASTASLAQGRGNGGGNDDNPGRGNGGGRGNAEDRGPDRDKGNPGNGNGGGQRAEQGGPGNGNGGGNPGRGNGGGNDNAPAQQAQRDRDDDGPGRGNGQGNGPDRDRDRDRDSVIIVDRDRDRDRDDPRIVLDRDYVILGGDRNRGLIDGCPPGLAKKNNGCMPPGLARQQEDLWFERQRYDGLFGRAYYDDYDYRYRDGYLYRYDRGGGLLGYLPALAGALGIGNAWPNQYQYDPAPQYYSNYYGLNRPYDYRYANNVLYGVDPQTQAIQSVAALLTGQSPQLGQPMPRGYDIYNVPYGYRDQYYDTPERNYRYNDGYVYQVDPTTQVVQAIIQLLT